MRGLLVVATVSACTGFTPRDVTPDDAPVTDAAVDTPDTGPPIPFLAGWTHRKPIDLLHAKVTTAPGVDAEPGIQIAIAADDNDIAQVAKADGSDLVFTTADGITLLPSELAHYVAGDYVAWVRIPSLSSVTDTRIYLYYGNATAVPPPPENSVWSNHLAVWHLEQDPGPGGAGDILDTSGNGVHGTADATMTPANLVPGVLGKALDFDGVGDVLEMPAKNFGSQFSISAWVNLGTGNVARTVIGNAPANGFRFYVSNIGTSNRRIVFDTDAGGAIVRANTEIAAIDVGIWAHLVVVIDRLGGVAKLFVNGVDRTTQSTISTAFPSSGDFEIGNDEGATPWKGQLDEIHIYEDMMPPERIRTNFANQSDPATFSTIGVEEVAP